MSMPVKTIIVATDLSARSDRAVDRAVLLAQIWRARLILLHAIEPGSYLETHPERDTEALSAVLPDSSPDVDLMPAVLRHKLLLMLPIPPRVI